MSDREKLVTGAALVLCYFTALHGGAYFAGNRLQEVGLAVLLALWGRNALAVGTADRSIGWHAWLVVPAACATSFVTFYAVVFSYHTGANPLPGMFALRYFLWILIAPILLFTAARGVSIREHQRFFWLALALLLLNYSFHAFTIDFESVHASENRSLRAFIGYDPWRGYRLKPNYYAMYLTVLVSAGMMVRERTRLGRRTAGLLLLAALAWLSVLLPRAGLLSVATATVLYAFVLSRPHRLHALFLAAPPAAFAAGIALLVFAGDLNANFQNDWSYLARLESSRTAMRVLEAHPLFGIGTASYYSLSYQDLFGRHFYPGDIGILGMAFRNGLLGAALLVFVQVALFVRLLRTDWLLRHHTGRSIPIVSGFCVLALACTFLLPIQPVLAFGFGFPILGFSLGFDGVARLSLLEVSS